MLLLAADFYYLKNIAGRRLVGLRWWNEVDPAGDSKWVFESSEPGTKVVNPTDSRFFWLALYVQPLLWVLMMVWALIRLDFLWLPLVSKLFLESPSGICCGFREKAGDGRAGRKGDRYTDVRNSDCIGAHHHEHARILTLRQVQPGVEFRWGSVLKQ